MYLSVLNYLRFPRDLFRVIDICVIRYQYVSAKEEFENLHDHFMIIHEVEKNLGEKQ
jgi:hypothetical protein